MGEAGADRVRALARRGEGLSFGEFLAEPKGIFRGGRIFLSGGCLASGHALLVGGGQDSVSLLEVSGQLISLSDCSFDQGVVSNPFLSVSFGVAFITSAGHGDDLNSSGIGSSGHGEPPEGLGTPDSQGDELLGGGTPFSTQGEPLEARGD